jgi:alpha-2-macroglobulin
MKPNALLLALVAALVSCSRTPPPPTPPDPAVISAYTSGVVSSRSVIRVRFAAPQVAADQVGRDAPLSPVAFEPRIKGRAVWASESVLEFRPEGPLQQGQDYAATLRFASFKKAPLEPATVAVTGAPAGEEFRFRFSVMKQSIAVAIDGLESAGATELAPQILRGTLTTSDVADPAAVEKVLTAVQKGGKTLPVEWEHSAGALTHAFVIRGITRTAQTEQVEVKWDGKPLDVRRGSSRLVTVPAIEAFKVTEIRAVQGAEDYILVRFSDPLRQKQDLSGLIWSPQVKDFRFGVQNNLVRIYATVRFPAEVVVNVETGILNVAGNGLEQGTVTKVAFGTVAPAVRLPGSGVILPTTQGLVIPVETMNLRGIMVEATRVFEDNVAQFLQVNSLDGQEELRRVGRVVWKKSLDIEWSANQRNQWIRSGLDLTQLVSGHTKGLYRLRVTFRRDQIAYACGEITPDEQLAFDAVYAQDGEQADDESSFWDAWDAGQEQRESLYRNRNNPCSPGFYMRFYDHDIAVVRNVVVSDIGLTARRGHDDSLVVAAANLKTTEPMAGVKLSVLDFQQQAIGTATTDSRGLAQVGVGDRAPFVVVADKDGQAGYLKLDAASALAVSAFDVGGADAPRGIKGFLYGERGIWRPGDRINLTFVLADPENRLPASHPVSMRFYDPQGRLVSNTTRVEGVGGFYAFPLATEADAPTGYWRAVASVGGARFEKSIRVETVRPNRLRIALDFGPGVTSLRPGVAQAELRSSWLHGAPARGLKGQVEVSLKPQPTRFAKWADYAFDDPVRVFETESREIFAGTLDNQGQARFDAEIIAAGESPGMLAATFTTRVFEPGGGASADQVTVPFHPFGRYVGVRLPRGDAARGMLLTDTRHRADIVLVDPDGNPSGDGPVRAELFKVRWRWWWDKGEDDLASYIGTAEFRPIASDTVMVRNGVGAWEFEVKYPAWGRYLLRVTDEQGGHATGRIVYIDWPGWAGRGQKEGMGAATILTFSADKPSYQVGEKATLTIPTAAKGRLLVSIEAGGRIVSSEWVETRAESTRVPFDITPAMAPNAYVHVSLLQPHMQTANDLPIRLYGVIPILVEDPRTRLRPVLATPDVLRPEETATITVSEAGGRPMAYTVAVVDEGLLGLTRFQTPDPWSHFYAKSASAVSTWDLYDFVAAAWGGTLEQMLAVGGGEDLEAGAGRKANRFPPMVQFLGPFELARGEKKSHALAIPQYVGAVRVMVVAATRDGAYGRVDSEVPVRKPLMVLADLPRVLSVGEEVELPVSVFALEPRVRDVTIGIEAQGALAPAAETTRVLRFADTGDQLATFRLRAGKTPGLGKVIVRGSSGGERAAQTIEIDVRVPSRPVADVTRGDVRPGGSWTTETRPFGVPGTSRFTLEVSRIPPLELGRRLSYLVTYPHGCVEQTTSAAFPQLYLDRLLELAPERAKEVQENVSAAIDRLRTFQTGGGGFSFWPGGAEADQWATSYAGHFIVEADKRGYAVPPGMIAKWKEAQSARALSWSGGDRGQAMQQAYRLFTLALAGQPALGAMNRLRETRNLPETARWLLAASYHLAGQPEVAERLAGDRVAAIAAYREMGGTYGSDVRDKAMILDAAALMGRTQAVEALLSDISGALSDDGPLATQTIAYSLLAVARYAGIAPGLPAPGAPGAPQQPPTQFSYRWGDGPERAVSSRAPIAQVALDAGGPGLQPRRLEVRGAGGTRLFTRLVSQGTPAPGEERAAANGLGLAVRMLPAGATPAPDTYEQGQDILVEVEVKNPGRAPYEQLALTHLVPAGWEIRPARLDEKQAGKAAAYDYQDVRDDRVLTYFGLKAGETKVFRVQLTASYKGTFYLPLVEVEAMYDPTVSARTAGRWIKVVAPAP